MHPMYPDTAQAYRCPFAYPSLMYCIADNCLSWVETQNEYGFCSRLSNERHIFTLPTMPLEVEPCGLWGEND